MPTAFRARRRTLRTCVAAGFERRVTTCRYAGRARRSAAAGRGFAARAFRAAATRVLCALRADRGRGAREPGGFGVYPSAGDRSGISRISEARAGGAGGAPCARRRRARGRSAATSTRSTVRRPPPRARHAEALALADRLEQEASTPAENPLLATAQLVRATAEWLAGDAAKANAFAKDARRYCRARPTPTSRTGRRCRSASRRAAAANSRNRSARCRTRCRWPSSRTTRFAAPSALYQLSNLYLTAEAAAERARREPFGLPLRRASPAARRRW